MKTLKIYPSAEHGQALAGLLAALGATTTLNGDWLLDCGEVSETILIIALPVNDDAALAGAVGSAMTNGQRVVGVWTPGATGDLPRPLGEFGGATVVWSVEDLRRVLCEELPVWQEAGGEPREGQSPKRNVC